MMFSLPIGLCAALLISLLAALQDARTGLIGNALTLPPLVIAPLYFGLTLGWQHGLVAMLASVLCGLIPYWMFRAGAAGGGDVKLFASLGALGGMDFGLSVMCLSFVVAAVYSCVLLAKSGGLKQTLINTLTLVTNVFRRPDHRTKVASVPMATVRMGVPIFVAALLWVIA